MEKLLINSSPHFRNNTVTKNIMGDVLIALLPAVLAGTLLFGIRVLVLCFYCTAFAVLAEYIYKKLMKQSCTAGDLSAAVTGLILSLNLPVKMPLWQAGIGCFVAIIIVKQLFGGLGKNFANPALAGRLVLFMSFAKQMSAFTPPIFSLGADTYTGATPLVAASQAAQTTSATVTAPPSYSDLFMGLIPGSVGEVCKLALIIGGIYLIARKVITPAIPLSFLGGLFILSWLFGADPLYQLLSGGAIFAAFFMATDYVTSPTTESGKIVFGIGCAFITVIIRLFASYPEGVSFALLIMNLLTPHIDRICEHKALGGAYN